MQVSGFFVRKRKSVALECIEKEGRHVLRSRKSRYIDPVSLPAQSEDVNLCFSCLFYYQCINGNGVPWAICHLS